MMGARLVMRVGKHQHFVVFFVHVLEDEARKEWPKLLLLLGEHDRIGGALTHTRSFRSQHIYSGVETKRKWAYFVALKRILFPEILF